MVGYLASLIIYGMGCVISAMPGEVANIPSIGFPSAVVAQELMEHNEVSINTYGTDLEFKKNLLAEIQAYVDAVSVTSTTPKVKGSVVNGGGQNEKAQFSLIFYDTEFSEIELEALSSKAGSTEDSINEFLCESLTYADIGGSKISLESSPATAKGSIENGEAVCEGYANAFSVLAEYAGIKSVKVRGYTGDIPHVVNVIDGGFVVDVTWNDKSENRYFMVPLSEYCEMTGFVPIVDYETAFFLKYGIV